MIYFLRKLFCIHDYEFDYDPDCGTHKNAVNAGKVIN